MQADDFYSRYASLMTLPPDDRHAGMCTLHTATLAEYTGWLRSITPEAAHSTSSDGRSIALVVGHIAAWDRFMLQACGEMLSGAAWPGFMELLGYLDENGERRDFQSIDAFNAFHADAQRGRPWEQIQIRSTRPRRGGPLDLRRARPVDGGAPGAHSPYRVGHDFRQASARRRRLADLDDHSGARDRRACRRPGSRHGRLTLIRQPCRVFRSCPCCGACS